MGIERDFSYDLDGFEFGRGTVYTVRDVDFGDAPLTTHDAPQPRGDGIIFGRDYRGGRVIVFDGNILTNRTSPGSPIAAPLAQAKMAAAWEREDIRLVPQAVLPLRMRRNGRALRVYGRPREFLPKSGTTTRGRVPYVCSFQCNNHLFYDDIEQMQTVTLVAEEQGGQIGPLIGPLIASTVATSSMGIDVFGTKHSWLKFRIYGPANTGFFINPDIEVVGQWRFKLNAQIAYDDSIVVDPHPWSRRTRSTLTNANMSGEFTANSVRTSAMKVPPGSHQIILRGIDPTGSARVEVSWRNTYGSF